MGANAMFEARLLKEIFGTVFEMNGRVKMGEPGKNLNAELVHLSYENVDERCRSLQVLEVRQCAWTLSHWTISE